MRIKLLSLAAALAASLILIGCGSSETEPPKGAMRPPDSSADYKVPTTKEEKIAAIKASPVPEAQKQEAINKVNAGP